jgi:hypothetical chaperone protein
MLMMCGLDFGTSNCSIGVCNKDGPYLVPITNEGPCMPSMIYVQRRESAAIPINEAVLARRVEAAKRAEAARRAQARKRKEPYKAFSDSQLETRERALLRRESEQKSREEYSSQNLAFAMRRNSKLLFGEDAIRANATAPTEGIYFKSPKLFLASDIDDMYLDAFRRVISAMLAEVRTRAEAEVGQGLRKVAIGHPVVYSAALGASGNHQALSLMEQCAISAGFQEVAFLPEPVAAAFNYEMSISREEVVLVVDVGGGTTDCAVVRVKPRSSTRANRSADVLSYSGDRVGGVDMDFHLAWQSIMPHLGKNSHLKNGKPVPHPILLDAISINDLPRQERFRRTGREIELLVKDAKEPKKIERLFDVWQQSLQFRLLRSAELAKIALSEKAKVTLSLGYVDAELEIGVSQDELRGCIEGAVSRIGSLAKEAVAAASAKVDKVFITGGASRSPAVLQSIKSSLGPDISVVRGDDFGSVTEGLTRYAQDFFAARNPR